MYILLIFIDIMIINKLIMKLIIRHWVYQKKKLNNKKHIQRVFKIKENNNNQMNNKKFKNINQNQILDIINDFMKYEL